LLQPHPFHDSSTSLGIGIDLKFVVPWAPLSRGPRYLPLDYSTRRLELLCRFWPNSHQPGTTRSSHWSRFRRFSYGHGYDYGGLAADLYRLRTTGGTLI